MALAERAEHLRLQVPAPSIFGEPTKALSVVVPAYNEEDYGRASAVCRSSSFILRCPRRTRHTSAGSQTALEPLPTDRQGAPGNCRLQGKDY